MTQRKSGIPDLRRSKLASSGKPELAQQRRVGSSTVLRDLGRAFAHPTKIGERAHSITSSARPTIGSGMVRPSALAVLRLITSSNLVGSMTGKSPGLTPLRTLPT